MKTTFPCDICIVRPRCRHKDYTTLFNHCTTISNLLYKGGCPDTRYRKSNFTYNVLKLAAILNPSKWRLNLESHGDGTRITVTGIIDQ